MMHSGRGRGRGDHHDVYRVWAASAAVGGGELYNPRASLLDISLNDTQKPLSPGTGDMCTDINTTGLFIGRTRGCPDTVSRGIDR